jgi:hypothetical protein
MADATNPIDSLISDLKDEIRRQITAERVAAAESGDKASRSLSTAAATAITELLNDAAELFAEFGVTFTPSDRERLLSVGLKNLGFIQTAYTQAQANPALVPGYVDMEEFKAAMEDMERKRALLTRIEQLGKTVSDSMMADSDSAFHDALDLYNYVKTAARQRVNGAETVYALLKPYFKRSKSGSTEPTEQQIERDVRGLLSGTKEGRVTIENENPDSSGGHRRVVDEVHPADIRTEVHTDYHNKEQGAKSKGATRGCLK